MEFPQKFLKPMLYLIEDARRARILSDRESVSLKDFALFVAGNDLDFSSANLDPEKGVTLHLK